MQLSLRDEKTKTLFMEALLELLTKRQDILEELIAKVALKTTEKTSDNGDEQISTKKQQSRLYFESLNLDFSSYQFDREQANER